MDDHNESWVREELRRAVDHLEVSPDLWARIRRRHRKEPRQRMLAVATSVALVVILAMAAFPVIRDAAKQQERLGETGPKPSATPLPPGMPGVAPQQWDRSLLGPDADGPTGPPAVLAHGSIAGRGDWTLVAYPMEGGVCYGFLETPDLVPGVGWCSPTDGMLVSHPQFFPGTGSPGVIVGFVHRDAASVLLRFPDGGSARLSGADGGFYERDGQPVDFYMSLLPPDAQAAPDQIEVRALDEAGQELESWMPRVAPTTTVPPHEDDDHLPTTTTAAQGDRPLGLESATGPLRSVGTGEVEGRRWELLAHPYADGICAGFSRQPPNWIAGSAWCKPVDAIRAGTAAATMTVDGGPTLPSFVWGAVSKDAALVRVHWPATGETVDLEPIGQDDGLDVNFYVFGILGAGLEDVAVTVYDANGRGLP